MFLLIIPLFVALIIALIVYGHIQAKRRREALARYAASRGLSFAPDRDASYEVRYPDFRGLQQGERSRYADNIIEGILDGRVTQMFDYHYTTTSRDSKGKTTTHHHSFSAVIVTGDIPLSPLYVRPEGFFDRVGAFFGFEDIDFELDAFNRAFYVKSPDRQWAFDVLHQETMEFLLSHGEYYVEMAGYDTIVYGGSTFEPVEFDRAVGVAEGVLDRLPEYLRRERSEGHT